MEGKDQGPSPPERLATFPPQADHVLVVLFFIRGGRGGGGGGAALKPPDSMLSVPQKLLPLLLPLTTLVLKMDLGFVLIRYSKTSDMEMIVTKEEFKFTDT